jgi:hypothetical protein
LSSAECDRAPLYLRRCEPRLLPEADQWSRARDLLVVFSLLLQTMQTERSHSLMLSDAQTSEASLIDEMHSQTRASPRNLDTQHRWWGHPVRLLTSGARVRGSRSSIFSMSLPRLEGDCRKYGFTSRGFKDKPAHLTPQRCVVSEFIPESLIIGGEEKRVSTAEAVKRLIVINN